ncbi:MAG: phosphoribosyltransferase family protein [bacterium]
MKFPFSITRKGMVGSGSYFFRKEIFYWGGFDTMAVHRYEPEKAIDIREYHASSFYSLELGGLSRILPLIPVESSLWLVGNEALCFGCDIGFTKIASRELVEKLSHLRFDCIVCPETKSLCFAYEISHMLSLQRFMIVRKRIEKGIPIAFSEEMTSITSPTPQFIFLDDYSAREIKGKKVILLDDTISTGGTMNALLHLMEKAQAEVLAIAAIWVEGPSYYQDLSDFILSDRLIFLDYLPVYSTGRRYEMLKKEKERVIWQHQTLMAMRNQREGDGLDFSEKNSALPLIS